VLGVRAAPTLRALAKQVRVRHLALGGLCPLLGCVQLVVDAGVEQSSTHSPVVSGSDANAPLAGPVALGQPMGDAPLLAAVEAVPDEVTVPWQAHRARLCQAAEAKSDGRRHYVRVRAKGLRRSMALSAVAFVMIGLSAPGCGGSNRANPPSPSCSTGTLWNSPPATALPSYLGLSQSAATAKASGEGRSIRVVGHDSSCSAITSDLRHDRVNLYIRGGRVTRAALF